MDFRRRLANATPEQDTVLTIGVFDGVHLGHRHLLQRLIELAGSQYLPTVVTFTNHPASFLRPVFRHAIADSTVAADDTGSSHQQLWIRESAFYIR